MRIVKNGYGLWRWVGWRFVKVGGTGEENLFSTRWAVSVKAVKRNCRIVFSTREVVKKIGGIVFNEVGGEEDLRNC
jgi:hypothetical protein